MKQIILVVVVVIALVLADPEPIPSPIFQFTGQVQATWNYSNSNKLIKSLFRRDGNTNNISIVLDHKLQAVQWIESISNPKQGFDFVAYLDHFIYEQHDVLKHSTTGDKFECTQWDGKPRTNPFKNINFSKAWYGGVTIFNGQIVNKWTSVDASLFGAKPTFNDTVYQDAFTGRTAGIQYFDQTHGAYQLIFSNYQPREVEQKEFLTPIPCA
jgi:hypothetical protein